MSLSVKEVQVDGFETLLWGEDNATGLNAFIALHNTKLGPGLGGVRVRNYATPEHAIEDVLRLSEGMTYKSALAGLPLGGGKAVITADPKDKTPQMMESFGQFVETLKGQYITAEDMNTNLDDMDIIHKHTKHVTGLKGKSGDPSPLTALGTYASIESIAQNQLKQPLNNLKVAVQGAGNVGRHLIDLLSRAGAHVLVADVNEDHLAKLPKTVTVIDPAEIVAAECDIFSPCAIGGILNEDSIPTLKCKAVVGAANNQLQSIEIDGAALMNRGILYAPDYLVNAGGVINIHDGMLEGGYNQDRAERTVLKIADRLQGVLRFALQQHISPAIAANLVAESIFSQ